MGYPVNFLFPNINHLCSPSLGPCAPNRSLDKLDLRIALEDIGEKQVIEGEKYGNGQYWKYSWEDAFSIG